MNNTSALLLSLSPAMSASHIIVCEEKLNFLGIQIDLMPKFSSALASSGFT